ncbi:hypothetical protein MNBD_GAMMA01-722 [hydrothermal vent metagenome]|uniref:Uncharacterized protein n=1 Tax=hydrothermal vent metagenome TaxID=652676 RepID=A0A3B0VGG3_9ZZZZ
MTTLNKIMGFIKNPNPDIETRDRVQAIGAYSADKNLFNARKYQFHDFLTHNLLNTQIPI